MPSLLSRRRLLGASLACVAGIQAAPFQSAVAAGGSASGGGIRGGFALDGLQVRLYSAAVQRPVKVLMVADTHLFRDDERGAPFAQFSGRMARAYNRTKHFRTGEPTNPEEGLLQSLAVAKADHADLVALVGDMVSFPSEAAVEWVLARLAETGLPYQYIAGNHDWHYEGMQGPLAHVRAAWSEQRLKPLYQGSEPLMSVQEIGGVRFVAMDNSTYEILPAQLEFFRQQAGSGVPMVLFLHIPLYAPGRPLGFGCGHPLWGAASDRNFAIERRPQWPEGGHTSVTMDFHREVFQASNLLGVFAGHTHQASLDVVGGIPQVVAGANATGAYVDIRVLPLPPA